MEGTYMILAQLSIYPIGSGINLGRFVKLHLSSRRMSTSIEVPDLPELFDLVSKIRQAQPEEGAQRIIIELKVDDRHDKQATLQNKINSVTTS